MRLKQRIYLTEDRAHAVNEHNPAGRYLLGDMGTEIPDSLAKKYGIFPSGKLPEIKKPEPINENGLVKSEPELIEKSIDQVENKMVESAPNKKLRKTSGLAINRLTDSKKEGE